MNEKEKTNKVDYNNKEISRIRVDFSLKRDVFFVVVGTILGAVTFGISETIFQVILGSPYSNNFYVNENKQVVL